MDQVENNAMAPGKPSGMRWERKIMLGLAVALLAVVAAGG